MAIIEIPNNQIQISQMSPIDILTATPEEKSNIVFMPEPKIETLPEMYDVVIVLGGVSQDARIRQAATSFHEGKIERIIVSGGIGFFNTDRITTEAEKMRKSLLDLDVPPGVITMEDKSRNTYENIKNSIEILIYDGYNLDSTIKAIHTSDFHLRRATGMMEQQLDGLEVFGIGAKDGKTDLEHWNDTRYGCFTISKEALLLLHYVKTGKISDFNLEVSGKHRGHARR